MMREHEIDIAIDLKGYTRKGGRESSRTAPRRSGALSRLSRHAGRGLLRLLIADPIVRPAGAPSVLREKVAYLPDTYQCNDRQARDRAARAEPRRDGASRERVCLLLLQQQPQDHCPRCSTSGCGSYASR